MIYTIRHEFSSLRSDVLCSLLAPVFIETGSNVGKGIDVALGVGFPIVYSIEAEQWFYEHCEAKYKDNPRVRLYHGDSPSVLSEIMPQIEERAVIYLDAHARERNPLLDELKAIAGGYRRDHTILIDDVRMFGTLEWNGLTKDEALSALYVINPRYQVTYADTPNKENDLMIARVDDAAA